MYAATMIQTVRRSGRQFTRETFRVVAQVLETVEVLSGEHDGFVKVRVVLHPGEPARVVLALAEDVRIGSTPLEAKHLAAAWDAFKRGEQA